MAAPRPLPGCRALDPLASALPSPAPRWPVFAVPLGAFVIVSLERPLSPAQPRAAGFTDAVSSGGHRPSQGQGLTPLTSVRRGQRSHLSQEQDGAPGSDGWPDRRGSRMLGVPGVPGASLLLATCHEMRPTFLPFSVLWWPLSLRKCPLSLRFADTVCPQVEHFTFLPFKNDLSAPALCR